MPIEVHRTFMLGRKDPYLRDDGEGWKPLVRNQVWAIFPGKAGCVKKTFRQHNKYTRLWF